ncbi:hypothetical protein [Croceicoccus naphthovorans]|uniref:Uncharacterized protein n=1 Tax=Croceicoccus naphthovorans TaxID=1348774 RepID=A0A0G3XDU6_9SPHN|nr:hypothetical protein [Croceicoccus naphthovorans]AKM09715.1 hypothetical protein AB433_06545 [Croceicoccus naphthovorans]MBB3990855.1 hypothetical protein [Croceicoccus naphthovorans]
MTGRIVSLAAFRAGISTDGQRLVDQVRLADYEFQMRAVHREMEILAEKLSWKDRVAIAKAMRTRRWEIFQSKHDPE